MTEWKYIVSAVVLGLCCYNGYTNVEAKSLLGQERCTWGPSYWCSNLTNAKNCKAVRHCIQTVWEKQTMPKDDDEICKICVDMVKQARDQLESNQTQDDLKAVFEGSCKLIPVTIVKDECIKLVDDFVPELVETLSSEMNPQVVCSVAGLCNSARIDKLLKEMKNVPKPTTAVKPVEDKKALCNRCQVVGNKMKQNFDSLTYDEFLENILRACGKLGSFSDSCAGIVFSHFEDIYGHMKNEFNADNVCHLAGVCSGRFHEHEDETGVAVEIKPSGDTGKITNESDDLPCEFCEKLVNHLKDILIANTTDLEFKRVLEGVCKQTGSFSKECLSLVDQYYLEIYNYLIGELDPEGVCFMAGICRKGVKDTSPLAPLLPSELVIKAIKPIRDQQLIGTDEKNSYKPLTHVSLKKNEANVKVISPELAQLPIERMVVMLPENKEVCLFCQYVLHYLQVEISDAGNEEKIKEVVESACSKLPKSITQECNSFIDTYGNAVIALLVQKIDPAEVCPSLGLCPRQEVKNVEISMSGGSKDKPNCPLCLFAVEQLEEVLKNNKTKESIQNALDRLCNHLSAKLRPECTSFVDTYYKQLVDVLEAEFTPQEVCDYLKLCSNDKPSIVAHHELIDSYHNKKRLMADHNNFRKPILPLSMLANGANGDIETNEIPDNTINGLPISLVGQMSSNDEKLGSPGCVICEWVVTKLDKLLANKNTDEEIKTIIRDACGVLPKNVTQQCNDFVNKYADLVIVMLTQELKPHQVCDILAMCLPAADIKESVLDCAVCEESVYVMEKILDNPNVDHKLEHIIEKTCYGIPSKYYDRCVKIIKTYGESIIHLLVTLPDSHSVCSKIGLCGEGRGAFVELSPYSTSDSAVSHVRKSSFGDLFGVEKCTFGPAYWCASYENADKCKSLNHCQKNVWKAPSPH